ncbi:restriction endonuclease subunit S [Clostridium massiliodielmoense]|uniref:restriction endonuclease subunit S n=1 Tax=Clostridium massiliodielmoense TaxID=1776385 RepID=UPI000A26B743|nr:restriction endonuclease subunit S [Clostridium massiliodielmoense]
MKFKEFKVGDLFEVKSNPQLNKDSFQFAENAKYPYFTRTVLNNGIAGYVRYLDDDHMIKGNSIAVGMIGMKFFYMAKPFYAGQFTKTIFPKFEGMTERIALYFIVYFNKMSEYLLGGLVRDFQRLFTEAFIKLPVDDNGNIDFQFIENRISELEAEHISELEAYLQVTGLDDYLLTDEDNNVLTCKKHYCDYRVGDLFDIHPTRAYKLTNDYLFIPNGKNPVVTNTSENHGRTGYSNLECTEHDIVTFSDTGTKSPESFFYQEGEFIGYPHVQGMYPYSDKWNKYSLNYLIVLLRKQTKGNFDYSTKMNRELISNMIVQLPVNSNVEIDFEYMEKYIRGIEKRAIAKVYDGLGKIIDISLTP